MSPTIAIAIKIPKPIPALKIPVTTLQELKKILTNTMAHKAFNFEVSIYFV
jgi:hypothetical protein